MVQFKKEIANVCGNTKLAIMLILPILCICKKTECNNSLVNRVTVLCNGPFTLTIY